MGQNRFCLVAVCTTTKRSHQKAKKQAHSCLLASSRKLAGHQQEGASQQELESHLAGCCFLASTISFFFPCSIMANGSWPACYQLVLDRYLQHQPVITTLKWVSCMCTTEEDPIAPAAIDENGMVFLVAPALLVHASG